MQAPGTAPLVIGLLLNGVSATPSQLASSACILVSVTCTALAATVTASWMRSDTFEVGDSARKYRSVVAAVAPAAGVTSAYTTLLAPGLTVLLVITAPLASLNTTVQPLGSVVVPKVPSVLA